MKMIKVFLTIALFIPIMKLNAQVPQKMTYQAIVRDSQGNLIKNKVIGIRIAIIKDSIDGLPVYVEVQSPSTNINGLVTLEIGNGIGFDTITWAKGQHFLKTEIDPNGNSTYTIIGTHQLLSVPYALHAKTAESLIGAEINHYVGELFGGGIIFYVDQNGQHGKICSLIDVGIEVVWSNIQTTVIGSSAQSHWDGYNNSVNIVGQVGHTNSAAMLCMEYTNEDYSTGIYSDWYLPSIDECNILIQVLYEIDKYVELSNLPNAFGLTKLKYWSSTEAGENGAWSYDFFINQYSRTNKAEPCNVRAIRAF